MNCTARRLNGDISKHAEKLRVHDVFVRINHEVGHMRKPVSNRSCRTTVGEEASASIQRAATNIHSRSEGEIDLEELRPQQGCMVCLSPHLSPESGWLSGGAPNRGQPGGQPEPWAACM